MLALVAGCAPTLTQQVVTRALPEPSRPQPCSACTTIPMPADVAGAIEGRIASLKQRGGHCETYGEVLENSLTSGRITLRPYMWREGSNLASAQGRPSGEMTLAREIDSLNVGVRTLGDVLWSVEHEAAHIAFRIPSGDDLSERTADEHVRACQVPSGTRSVR